MVKEHHRGIIKILTGTYDGTRTSGHAGLFIWHTFRNIVEGYRVEMHSVLDRKNTHNSDGLKELSIYPIYLED